MNSERSSGLLVDTNLLVLYAVGKVNENRIKTFKRTSQYSKSDYNLLLEVHREFQPIYTVAHIMSEVSNLTDLPGVERRQARLVVKEAISLLQEVPMASSQASDDPFYEKLGLADAAIGAVARIHGCTLLTDDLDLYLLLSHHKLPVENFTHIRASSWGM